MRENSSDGKGGGNSTPNVTFFTQRRKIKISLFFSDILTPKRELTDVLIFDGRPLSLKKMSKISALSKSNYVIYFSHIFCFSYVILDKINAIDLFHKNESNFLRALIN